MNRIFPTTVSCALLCLFASLDRAAAQQVVQGDMKVAGNLSATSIDVSGGKVLTTKDVATIQSQVLDQVAKEITNRLRNNSNSNEMQRFSEQVTSAVAKTIGVTNQELTVLRRDLKESNRAGATSINEMRTALANMQRSQAAAEREIASLRRELDQLRRDLNRR
jgi:hypothetical protein